MSSNILNKKSHICFNYQIIERIGNGGEAVIYKAKCNKKENENNYAIRVVTDPTEDRVKLIRMLRELIFLSHIKHQNIIEMLDFDYYCTSGGLIKEIYIIMPLMDYRLAELSIKPEWHQNPNKNYMLRSIMIQLLSGVDYLHTNNIIHRDLSMSNVMINNNLTLKIIDFGLSRECQKIMAMTNNQTALNFRPWELVSRTYQYDYKVDIWSVGCIFAQLLTGEPLCFFNDNERKKIVKHEQILLEKILSVAELPDNFNCQQFIQTCLPHHAAHMNNIIRRSIDERYGLNKFPHLNDNDNPEYHNANEGLYLLKSMVKLMPEKRCSAKEALNFNYLKYHPKYPNRTTNKATIPNNVHELLSNINTTDFTTLTCLLDIEVSNIKPLFINQDRN